MVRVSRDEHLIDHFLDQEQPPDPPCLRARQFGLQVGNLSVGARWWAATLVDDADQEAIFQEPYLDFYRDVGVVLVTVFRGFRRRLGPGSLERLEGPAVVGGLSGLRSPPLENLPSRAGANRAGFATRRFHASLAFSAASIQGWTTLWLSSSQAFTPLHPYPDLRPR
jgi:hypothetical protein